MHLRSISLLALLSTALNVLPVKGATTIVNRTIDDTFGDPVTGIKPIYSPLSEWNAGPGCTTCGIQPDPTQLFNGTWHDATYDPGQPTQDAVKNLTVTFNGTAIYLYVVAFNQVPSNENTSMLFNYTLDGQPAGVFSYIFNPDSDVVTYNYNIFSKEGLELGNHAFTLVTGWHQLTYIMFDYAVYTTVEDDASASTTGLASTTIGGSSGASQPTTSTGAGGGNKNIAVAHKSSAGAIAGGVVGAVVGLAIILALVLFCLRRSRKPQQVGKVPQHADLLDSESSDPALGGNPQMAYASQHITPYPSVAGSGSYTRSASAGRQASVDADQAVINTSNAGGSVDRRASVAAERQAALERRMQEKLRVMSDLERRTTLYPSGPLVTPAPTSYAPSSSDALSVTSGLSDSTAMREEMMSLRSQVAELQGMMRSQWAMGLTDQAPPEYTAAEMAETSATSTHV